MDSPPTSSLGASPGAALDDMALLDLMLPEDPKLKEQLDKERAARSADGG
jgi:hypothetical protein